MSRFSSLFDALSDKKARFLAEKEFVNDLVFDSFFNSLKDKETFDAKVLSGAEDGDPSRRVNNGQDDIVALKVRPIQIHNLALPDPCGNACRNADSGYISYLMALHPTAYSLPLEEGSPAGISNGDIVECYFEDRAKFRKLRWRKKKDGVSGNFDHGCGAAASAVSAFTSTDRSTTPTILDVPDDDPRLQVQQRTGTYNGNPIRNGQIEDNRLSDLKNIDGQGRLLTPAATAFNKMAKEFLEREGYRLKVNSSYRTIADQQRLKRKELSGEGNPAAIPGRSNHGWGLAVDINTKDQDGKTKFRSDIFQWLTQNAGRFDFIHPEWACETCAKAEAHHWEYKGSTGLKIDE